MQAANTRQQTANFGQIVTYFSFIGIGYELAMELCPFLAFCWLSHPTPPTKKKPHKSLICRACPFFVACCLRLSAEREGFEPPEPRSSTVFKTAAIDHSAISPMHLKHCAFLQKRCKCICFFCYYKQFHQLLFLFFITSYLSISILLINTRIHTR